MSVTGFSDGQHRVIRELGTYLATGGHLTIGDVYLVVFRAAAEANIENHIMLEITEAMLNKWVAAGVVIAAKIFLYLRRLRDAA